MNFLNFITYPFRKPAPPPPRPETGFFTDTTLCIGCKACEVACKQWNQLPADGYHWSGKSYDNTSTLSASTWRHVTFIEQFGERGAPGGNALLVPGGYAAEQSDGANADGDSILEKLLAQPKPGRWLMMSDVCKHCQEAPCQLACPTGAIIHNEFSDVYIQNDICNGCGYCVAACPFGVITRDDVDGHAHKCTLCYDRQRDEMTPACAKACPTGSIVFGRLDDLREQARSRVNQLHGRGQTNAYLYGDAPSGRYPSLHAFFLLLDRPSLYGLPENPEVPQLHLVEDYLRMAVGVALSVAAIVVPLLSGAHGF